MTTAVRGGVAVAALAILAPSVAFAYVGPGVGMGAVGSLLALIGAVVLGIVGFVWYPIKRLIRLIRSKFKSAPN